jgi:predicted Zn-dependent protease
MWLARRSLIGRLPTALLLLCALSKFLPAQQNQQYSLLGEIQISRGSFPPHRVEVILETRGARAGATYADDEGKFSFNQLVPNVYYVVINDPDFQPVRQSYEIRELSGANNFVQVTLIPKQKDVTRVSPNDRTGGGNPFLVDTSEYKKHYAKNAVKEFDGGNKAAQEGNGDEAIRRFSKAIALEPGFYAARNNLGLTYLGKMDYAHAEEQFQDVLRLNPSDEQAYFNLGNVYLLSKHFPEAQQTLEKGLQRRPDSAFGKFLLGTVFSRVGDRARAERLLRESVEMDSNMSKARLELVNLYIQETRNAEAITELKAFLKSSPTDPFAPKARQVLGRLEAQTQSR